MLLKTSRDKTYNAAWVSTLGDALLFEIHDLRTVGDVAPEFDGLEWLERESKDQGNERYDGFSVLVSISRTTVGIQCKLRKGADNA